MNRNDSDIRPDDAVTLLQHVASLDLTSSGDLEHYGWTAEWMRDVDAAHIRVESPRRCDPMETVSVLVAFVQAGFTCLKCDHGPRSEFHLRLPVKPELYLETAADGSDRLVRMAA